MNIKLTTAPRARFKGYDRGSILIPCLFILTLLMFLTTGILQVGGTGTSISNALAEQSQAKLAALSGLEVAYSKLKTDLYYTGEQCAPFPGSDTLLDITVTPLDEKEFEVVSRGIVGDSESVIRTRVCAMPYFNEYPLTVGNNAYLKGTSKILGDCCIRSYLWGKTNSEITGNVFMTGDRSILYDAEGAPVDIDGYPPPRIGGAVYCNAPVVEFPGLILDELYDIALAQDQVYSGTEHFNDVSLEGVLYFEGLNARPYFKDVTIKGVLVCENVAEIRVDGGFFKIRCDDDLFPNVAVVAPDSTLWVDPNGHMDVFGMTVLSSTDFQGKGTFTGPLIVLDDLLTLPDSLLYCQFPSFMKDEFEADSLWAELRIVEMEYEEL